MRGLLWFVVGFWVGAVIVSRYRQKEGTISYNEETSEQVIGETENLIGALEGRRPLRRREELWKRQVGDILERN